jgi:hypothetical protein
MRAGKVVTTVFFFRLELIVGLNRAVCSVVFAIWITGLFVLNVVVLALVVMVGNVGVVTIGVVRGDMVVEG